MNLLNIFFRILFEKNKIKKDETIIIKAMLAPDIPLSV
jgi:hypothetical protein